MLQLPCCSSAPCHLINAGCHRRLVKNIFTASSWSLAFVLLQMNWLKWSSFSQRVRILARTDPFWLLNQQIGWPIFQITLLQNFYQKWDRAARGAIVPGNSQVTDNVNSAKMCLQLEFLESFLKRRRLFKKEKRKKRLAFWHTFAHRLGCNTSINNYFSEAIFEFYLSHWTCITKPLLPRLCSVAHFPQA